MYCVGRLYNFVMLNLAVHEVTGKHKRVNETFSFIMHYFGVLLFSAPKRLN